MYEHLFSYVVLDRISDLQSTSGLTEVRLLRGDEA